MEATEQANDQATEAQTEPSQTPSETGGETQAPDVSEANAALLQRVEALEQQRQEPEDDSVDTDWIDQLYGDTEEPEQFAGEEQQPYFDPAQQQMIEAEPQTGADLQALIDQAVEQRMVPYLAGQEVQARTRELEEFASENPDIKDPEMLDKIRDQIAPIAEAYDDETLLTFPPLVKQAYQAIQANAAAEAETPAEEAASRGASIETGAGASAPGDEPYEQKAISEIMSSGGGKTAFT